MASRVCTGKTGNARKQKNGALNANRKLITALNRFVLHFDVRLPVRDASRYEAVKYKLKLNNLPFVLLNCFFIDRSDLSNVLVICVDTTVTYTSFLLIYAASIIKELISFKQLNRFLKSSRMLSVLDALDHFFFRHIKKISIKPVQPFGSYDAINRYTD